MRAFFCLELPEAVRSALVELAKPLRRSSVRASWVPQENLHITLFFLGEIDRQAIPALTEAARLAIVAAEMPAQVPYQLDRLGAFPRPDRPRIVWAGCQHEPEALLSLAEAMRQSLAAQGYPADDRRFTVHATLARVKERGRSRALDDLADALKSQSPFQLEGAAEAITLMESRLTPQGAVYRPLTRIQFAEESPA